MLAFDGDPDKRLDVRLLDVINTMARFFRLIPEEMITEKINPQSRTLIAKFLRDQAQRFEAQP